MRGIHWAGLAGATALLGGGTAFALLRGSGAERAAESASQTYVSSGEVVKAPSRERAQLAESALVGDADAERAVAYLRAAKREPGVSDVVATRLAAHALQSGSSMHATLAEFQMQREDGDTAEAVSAAMLEDRWALGAENPYRNADQKLVEQVMRETGASEPIARVVAVDHQVHEDEGGWRVEGGLAGAAEAFATDVAKMQRAAGIEDEAVAAELVSATIDRTDYSSSRPFDDAAPPDITMVAGAFRELRADVPGAKDSDVAGHIATYAGNVIVGDADWMAGLRTSRERADELVDAGIPQALAHRSNAMYGLSELDPGEVAAAYRTVTSSTDLRGIEALQLAEAAAHSA